VTEAIKITQSPNVEAFRKLILQETGVAVCHREHFGSALSHEVQRYVRYQRKETLKIGLKKFSLTTASTLDLLTLESQFHKLKNQWPS